MSDETPIPRYRKNAMPFAEWFETLSVLGLRHDWPIENPVDWHGYYEDDYTPLEALKQDMSYGL